MFKMLKIYLDDTGSFGGGSILTIDGTGFGSSSTTTVLVCNNPCPIKSITYEQITCEVPANSGG